MLLHSRTQIGHTQPQVMPEMFPRLTLSQVMFEMFPCLTVSQVMPEMFPCLTLSQVMTEMLPCLTLSSNASDASLSFTYIHTTFPLFMFVSVIRIQLQKLKLVGVNWYTS